MTHTFTSSTGSTCSTSSQPAYAILPYDRYYQSNRYDRGMPLTGGPLLPKVAPSQTKIASLNFKDQYVCSSPALYPRATYNFADPPCWGYLLTYYETRRAN